MKTLEMGEQVWIKPKRKKTIQDRSNLAARWLDAAWVGFDEKSHEHLVVLAKGGPAMRVRSIRAKPESERWSGEAIEEIKATGDKPNPKNEEQAAINPEGSTEGIEFGDQEELPEAPVQERATKKMDFRITPELLKNYRYTAGCPGCTAKLNGKQGKHNAECRRRIEEAMKAKEPDDERLARRDRRFFDEPVGQGQSASSSGAQAASNGGNDVTANRGATTQ